ncbi:cell envelope integrity protein TolA, partial [Marichromatium bheemlicum]
ERQAAAARAEAERRAAAEAARREAERQAAEEAARREAERQAAAARAEAERRAAAEAARREAERQAAAARREQLEREAELLAEREQRRLEEELTRETELLEALEAEETARAASPGTGRATTSGGGGGRGSLSSAEQRQIDYYKGVIGDRVRQHFSYPPGMSEGLSVEFEVRVTSAGYIVPGSVAMLRSSGTPAFDQAALAALWGAEPLPVPTGTLFDQFREFTFTFRP